MYFLEYACIWDTWYGRYLNQLLPVHQIHVEVSPELTKENESTSLKKQLKNTPNRALKG